MRAVRSWHAHRVDRVHEPLQLDQELAEEQLQLGAAIVALGVTHQVGAIRGRLER